ncbi:MAG: helix-turn-helix domain-containing protein [Actinomycetota bacterium]
MNNGGCAGTRGPQNPRADRGGPSLARPSSSIPPGSRRESEEEGILSSHVSEPCQIPRNQPIIRQATQGGLTIGTEPFPLARLIAEQRKGQSLSLRGVARLMRRAAGEEGQYSGVDPQTIHDYERGRIPHPDPLRWLAAALGLPVEQVATAASQQRVARRQQRLAGIPPSLNLPRSASRIVEEVKLFTMRDLGLGRREAIKMLGAVVFGAPLTEPLERWAMADPVVMTDNFSGSIGEEEMTRLEANVHTLRDWESRFRMGVRRKAVIGQLNEVADLVKGSQSSAVTSRLFKVMAELSRIAGFMSYDAGMHGAAQKYYSLALSATDAGGDRLFGVDILLAMSRQMLDLDRPTDGLELVRLAFEGRGVSMPPGLRRYCGPVRRGPTRRWGESRRFSARSGSPRRASPRKRPVRSPTGSSATTPQSSPG